MPSCRWVTNDQSFHQPLCFPIIILALAPVTVTESLTQECCGAIHPSLADRGKISLHQPRGFSHKDERTRAKLTLSPLGDKTKEPRGGLRQMKKTGPIRLCFFLHSTNICRDPGRFVGPERSGCKDGWSLTSALRVYRTRGRLQQVD